MLRFVLLLIVTVATTPAIGADISVQNSYVKGRPYFTFSIKGTLAAGDDVRFAALIEGRGEGQFLELDSPGGDLKAALLIGDVVHNEMMVTVVRARADCSSACVFILQSGTSRMVAPGGTVGLHRPKFPSVTFAALAPAEARKKYNEAIEAVRVFWDTMGGTSEAFEIMMRTPSDKMHTIGDLEALRLGLDGDDPAVAEYDHAVAVENTTHLFDDLIEKAKR